MEVHSGVKAGRVQSWVTIWLVEPYTQLPGGAAAGGEGGGGGGKSCSTFQVPFLLCQSCPKCPRQPPPYSASYPGWDL